MCMECDALACVSTWQDARASDMFQGSCFWSVELTAERCVSPFGLELADAARTPSSLRDHPRWFPCPQGHAVQSCDSVHPSTDFCASRSCRRSLSAGQRLDLKSMHSAALQRFSCNYYAWNRFPWMLLRSNFDGGRSLSGARGSGRALLPRSASAWRRWWACPRGSTGILRLDIVCTHLSIYACDAYDFPRRHVATRLPTLRGPCRSPHEPGSRWRRRWRRWPRAQPFAAQARPLLASLRWEPSPPPSRSSAQLAGCSGGRPRRLRADWRLS